MTKTTITERINGINFDSLTHDDFDFLVERALKSVRKGNPNAVRKPSKTQVENEGFKGQILDLLGEGKTATQVGADLGISVQRASAILKQMVDAGTVAKAKVGKALLFTAVK
jgi:hypothetical protein